MSDSRPSGADSSAPSVTVEDKGIAIEKRFAADEFDTPAIVLNVENGRASPVSLRIIDPLPEELDQSDIGFHPEYAAEGWTRREDGDLQLDRELGAGEGIKSVYGIRLSEVQDPASLLREPEIDEVEEIAEVDAESPGNPAASAEDIDQAIPDEEGDDGGPGASAGDESASGASAGDRGGAGSGAGARRAGETVDSLGTPTTDGETVAEALAAELERGSVDDATLRTLNEHLSPRLAESSQVRLDRVQSRLSDLEAYTDALEGILDTMGTDEAITRRMETVQEDLEKVAASTDALRDDLDGVTEDLEATDASVEALDEELRGEIQDVESQVESVSDAVDDLDGQIGDVDDRIDDIEQEMGATVTEIENTIDAISSDLEGSIEDVRSDVDELMEWRDTFLGAVNPGDDGGGEE